MTTKEKIIELLKIHKKLTSRQLCEKLGITRQALNKHIKKLIESGVVIKQGNTKGTVYIFSEGKKCSKPYKKVTRRFEITGLSEADVFGQFAALLELEELLRKNVYDIIEYSFTEILNNAIEHSNSSICDVEMIVNSYNVEFMIKDYGIGLYNSVAKKFGFADEEEALFNLMKGKLTTMPERHTGEGIFFVSRAGDFVQFRSHRLIMAFDNLKRDVFVGKKRFIKGTEVIFKIRRRSKRKSEEIFALYAPEEFDYKFEKTKVNVRLLSKRLISRSQAKRMLFGLEKFREVILDFNGVEVMGQSFADEIFRVFKKLHPEVKINVVNANAAVERMISHVKEVDKKI